MSKGSFAAIVPAAGLGTRMKSKTPKFLHKLCGRTMISHIVLQLNEIADEIVLVIGTGSELVKEEINLTCADFVDKIRFIEQGELLGSGHATKIGLSALKSNAENVIVVLGDMPLLTSEVLGEMCDAFSQNSAEVLVSTARLENPFGYGRIVRDENRVVKQIVEEKDCDDTQIEINECNMYPFVFSRNFLEIAIEKLDANNSQGEQYLTDVVQIARQSNVGVTSFTYDDSKSAQGANDRAQMAILEKIMREKINDQHMKNGVTITDPEHTYIDADVVIEPDVTILPGTSLQGRTTIASGCIIGPNSQIIDSSIGNNCVIESSKIASSVCGHDVTVGPFSSLRSGTDLRKGVHIGTSVELKNTVVGKGTKIPHLSYIGDAEIGENSNLGAGTTTANYDGVSKHKTVIGNNVKTGVNTVLVAPVVIGDGAYTGAGAVVVSDVPAGSLAKGVPAKIDDEWIEPSKR